MMDATAPSISSINSNASLTCPSAITELDPNIVNMYLMITYTATDSATGNTAEIGVGASDIASGSQKWLGTSADSRVKTHTVNAKAISKSVR